MFPGHVASHAPAAAAALRLGTGKVLTLMWMWVLTSHHIRGTVMAAPAAEADSDTLWLSDQAYYNEINFYDKPQADQAVPEETELCPPVPAALPGGACVQRKCRSDRECGDAGRRKCCYNGCVYTCLPELKPPAFLDWIREPRRRLRSGLSWLVSGPDLANEEEGCSTSPVSADSDPLLCPDGYFCSLHQLGDPERGIPNQGVCLKLTDDVDPTETPKEDEATVPSVVTHAHACDLTGLMLLDGHTIILDGYECICINAHLHCGDAPEQKGDITAEHDKDLYSQYQGDMQSENEEDTIADHAAEQKWGITAEHDGDWYSEYQGDMHAENEGDTTADHAVEQKGGITAEHDGDLYSEYQGDMQAENEGDTIADNEGDIPAEHEGEITVKLEGDITAEHEGVITAEDTQEITAKHDWEITTKTDGRHVEIAAEHKDVTKESTAHAA